MEHDSPARPGCNPECRKKCVGTFTQRYKIYEKCCYKHVILCCHCGHEFHHKLSHCPACGAQTDAPPPMTGCGPGLGLGLLAGATYPEYYPGYHPGYYLYPCQYSYYGYPYPYFPYPYYPV